VEGTNQLAHPGGEDSRRGDTTRSRDTRVRARARRFGSIKGRVFSEGPTTRGDWPFKFFAFYILSRLQTRRTRLRLAGSLAAETIRVVLYMHHAATECV
jgi:hypothetical protein